MTINPEHARRLVRESYDRLGAGYAEWSHENVDPVRARYLALVRDYFSEGSRILDLGCGDGSQVTAQLAKRYDTIGIDISSTQIEQARRLVPAARFIQADITEIELTHESFDGVVAFYCLTHTPQPELPGVIEGISRWLRPGGTFIGSFGAADEPGSVQNDWLGVPMFFSGCTPATNRRLLSDLGLMIQQDRIETHEEFGQEVRFHWIVASKLST